MARVLRYVTTDAMGSVTSVLSSTGEVLERRSYDAFGKMTCMLPDGTPVAASPTGLKIGFQGQQIDELTGMYQMGYRWYSPVLGRWVSRDPIGLEGGVNVSTFALNSPSDYTDEFGESVFDGDTPFDGESVSLDLGVISIGLTFSVEQCPYEIEISGEISRSFSINNKFIRKLSRSTGSKLDLGVSAGVEGDAFYSECLGVTKSTICLTVDLSLAAYFNAGTLRSRSSGQFLMNRRGIDSGGGAKLCLDLCKGDVSISGHADIGIYANFGTKKRNSSYTGDLYSTEIQYTFWHFESARLLKKYCDLPVNPDSCCCQKKYGHGKGSLSREVKTP